MNCPKCTSPNVRRSRHKSWKDFFAALRREHAFRCRQCGHRFYRAEAAGSRVFSRIKAAFGTSRNPGVKRGRRSIRPWMIEMAIFGALLLIFLVFLRYLTSEPSGGSDSGKVYFTTNAHLG